MHLELKDNKSIYLFQLWFNVTADYVIGVRNSCHYIKCSLYKICSHNVILACHLWIIYRIMLAINSLFYSSFNDFEWYVKITVFAQTRNFHFYKPLNICICEEIFDLLRSFKSLLLIWMSLIQIRVWYDVLWKYYES